jgi:hypothetical protein
VRKKLLSSTVYGVPGDDLAQFSHIILRIPYFLKEIVHWGCLVTIKYCTSVWKPRYSKKRGIFTILRKEVCTSFSNYDFTKTVVCLV